MKRLLITICGRAGSKGFKNKNLKNFCGKPLVYYSLSAAELFIKKHPELEIDVALNNLALKSHQMDVARQELDEMLELTKGRVLVKAVFEHSIFDEDEKEAVLKMLKSSGVTFIKIQNMLSGHGARVEDVQYAASILGRHIAIKIDGGIKTLQQAQDLLAAGASRLGLTATAKIAAEAGIH